MVYRCDRPQEPFLWGGGDFGDAFFLKKNLNASRPSEHPSAMEKNVKTFRWDHRLQKQNPFMAFKRVPRWW